MSATLKLPPTDRDFEIYDAIHIACSSTRCQAELHHISQARVRQIVRRVVEWLGEVLPPQAKVAKEQETHLARQIAADRFQRQLEQMTTLWDATQETKYASLRIRLTTAQARLGVVGGLIDGLAADAIEGIPVPAWQAPAGPPALAPDADPNPSTQTEIRKSLLPPPDAPRDARRRLKLLPAELCDPIAFDEITPEIIAARAAWGFPFSPDLLQKLQEYQQRSRTAEPVGRGSAVGRGSPDPAHSGHSDQNEPTATTASRLPPTPNSQLPIPSPFSPPSEECSPSLDKLGDFQPSASGPLAINDDAPPTYNKDAADQDDQTAPQNPASQPLLTTRDPLPVTVFQLTPNQPGATSVPFPNPESQTLSTERNSACR